MNSSFTSSTSSNYNSQSILFVCTGTTCRSPMAEGLLKAKLGEEEQIKISSAGVSAMPGQPASRETQAILVRKNAIIEGFKSRQVDEEIISGSDIIVAMTESHAGVIRHYFPDSEVQLICNFIDPEEGLAGEDLPDPYGMSHEAYEEVAEVIELALPGILNQLKK